MTDNIDSAPGAKLADAPATGGYGSLERGVAGEYELEIGAVISEAWAKTDGFKGKAWLALLLYFLIYVLASLAVALVMKMMGVDGDPQKPMSQLLPNLIQSLLMIPVTVPLMVGLIMLGVRHAMGVASPATLILRFYDKVTDLSVTMVLMYLMIAIGFVLLILPGIYLAVGYYLATPLVADKKLGPWAALEASRKAVGKKWWRIFGLALVLTLINLLAGLLLLIGLVWTIPMSLVAWGIVYRNIFGCEPETLAI